MSKRTGAIQPFKTDRIKISPELERVQLLMPIDPSDRDNLRKDIQQNGLREPLKVYEKGGDFFLLAGRNRLDIALDLKIEKVPIEILRDLPESEREQFCIDDNLNRRHLTTRQKQALIDRELINNPEQSNNAIAQKTKTTDKTVAKRRKEKEATSEIPKLAETKGADGKIRPASRNTEKSSSKINQQKDSTSEIPKLMTTKLHPSVEFLRRTKDNIKYTLAEIKGKQKFSKEDIESVKTIVEVIEFDIEKIKKAFKL